MFRRLNKEGAAYILLLFLLQPLFSLIYALRKYYASWAKNILWLFIIYYGLTFVISNSGIDANRQRDALELLYRTDISLSDFIKLLYSKSSSYLDIVQPVIIYAVSRLTSDYRILFAVYGLIFGYFYSRNIWTLIKLADYKLNNFTLLILITFAFVIGFWNINGFRMYAAAHVFYFGMMMYLIENKKHGLILAASSFLFHFSFMLPTAVMMIFFLIRNRLNLYFWFFVLSFFITEINLGGVREILTNMLPDIFEGKIMAYTYEGSVKDSADAYQSQSWHARYYLLSLKWVIISFMVYLFLRNKKEILSDGFMLRVFCFSLLFLGVSNIASLIPSTGRFLSVAYLFALSGIFLFFVKYPFDNFLKITKPIIYGLLLLFCIVALRVSFDTIGLMTVFGNPIFLAFGSLDTAIIDILK